MAQDSKSRKLDQYIVRFPNGMRDEIKAAADANNRSMNAEILARLSEVDELRGKLEEATVELAAARDPEVTRGMFSAAITALTKSGFMIRHTDVYTQEAEEWRYIRPFVIKGDKEIIAALSEGDLVRALSIAKAQTPADQKPPSLTTLLAQEDKSIHGKKSGD